jgi:hypothetical protein
MSVFNNLYRLLFPSLSLFLCNLKPENILLIRNDYH